MKRLLALFVVLGLVLRATSQSTTKETQLKDATKPLLRKGLTDMGKRLRGMFHFDVVGIFKGKVNDFANRMVPRLKKLDWGECDGEKASEENPCVTYCKSGKCKPDSAFLFMKAAEGKHMFTNVNSADIRRAAIAWLSFGQEKEKDNWKDRMDAMENKIKGIGVDNGLGASCSFNNTAVVFNDYIQFTIKAALEDVVKLHLKRGSIMAELRTLVQFFKIFKNCLVKLLVVFRRALGEFSRDGCRDSVLQRAWTLSFYVWLEVFYGTQKSDIYFAYDLYKKLKIPIRSFNNPPTEEMEKYSYKYEVEGLLQALITVVKKHKILEEDKGNDQKTKATKEAENEFWQRLLYICGKSTTYQFREYYKQSKSIFHRWKKKHRWVKKTSRERFFIEVDQHQTRKSIKALSKSCTFEKFAEIKETGLTPLPMVPGTKYLVDSKEKNPQRIVWSGNVNCGFDVTDEKCDPKKGDSFLDLQSSMHSQWTKVEGECNGKGAEIVFAGIPYTTSSCVQEVAAELPGISAELMDCLMWVSEGNRVEFKRGSSDFLRLYEKGGHVWYKSSCGGKIDKPRRRLLQEEGGGES